MTHSLHAIRANAHRLHELHSRIGETFKHRSRSRSDYEAWERACAEFRKHFDELCYPGGGDRWQAFMAGDSAEVDVAIAYLEADPFHFGSGYQKEAIWTRLKKSHLHRAELSRLQAVARGYLIRRAHRHFWYMVRFVRVRGTNAFWHDVTQLSQSSIRTPESIKATWLVLARENRPVRQWITNERWRSSREPGYEPNMDFLHRHEA